MMRMPKLLLIIGVVAAAILVAGCSSVSNQTPSTTSPSTTSPAAAGTQTVTGTPAATGTLSPASTSTTMGVMTVTDTPADSGTGSSTGSTVLTMEMNESTVAVKVNSRLTLELAENPSTGYAWNLTTTDGLRVVSDTYVPPSTGSNVVGAEGTHRWEIDAITAGLQEINGVYRRSWENTTADSNTFMVEVSVEA